LALAWRMIPSRQFSHHIDGFPLKKGLRACRRAGIEAALDDIRILRFQSL
jgi:hypothetical protein